MYKYIKAFKKGYTMAINDSFNDYLNDVHKEFKYINDKKILSKLFDIGYIKGYKKFYKMYKNNIYYCMHK